MGQTLSELLDTLTLVEIEPDVFEGLSPDQHAFSRIYGGQLFAQMLLAAGKTIEQGRDAHSMHAYFLRPGRQRLPIRFQVSRGMDGRSFSNRRVIATQDGREICNMTASFTVAPPETSVGPEYQLWTPSAPPPESLPSTPDLAEQYAEVLSYVAGQGAIEFRFVNGVATESDPDPGRWKVWFRIIGELPDTQLAHSAAVAYLSDLFLLETTLRPHSIGWLDDVDFATIDYSMWFHRPFRLTGWSLLGFGAMSAHNGRGLTFGELFTADRQVLASMAQEGVTRWKPGRAEDLRNQIESTRLL